MFKTASYLRVSGFKLANIFSGTSVIWSKSNRAAAEPGVEEAQRGRTITILTSSRANRSSASPAPCQRQPPRTWSTRVSHGYNCISGFVNAVISASNAVIIGVRNRLGYYSKSKHMTSEVSTRVTSNVSLINARLDNSVNENEIIGRGHAENNRRNTPESRNLVIVHALDDCRMLHSPNLRLRRLSQLIT